MRSSSDICAGLPHIPWMRTRRWMLVIIERSELWIRARRVQSFKDSLGCLSRPQLNKQKTLVVNRNAQSTDAKQLLHSHGLLFTFSARQRQFPVSALVGRVYLWQACLAVVVNSIFMLSKSLRVSMPGCRSMPVNFVIVLSQLEKCDHVLVHPWGRSG